MQPLAIAFARSKKKGKEKRKRKGEQVDSKRMKRGEIRSCGLRKECNRRKRGKGTLIRRPCVNRVKRRKGKRRKGKRRKERGERKEKRRKGRVGFCTLS
jgi:hypothetical protein